MCMIQGMGYIVYCDCTHMCVFINIYNLFNIYVCVCLYMYTVYYIYVASYLSICDVLHAYDDTSRVVFYACVCVFTIIHGIVYICL